MFSIVAVKDINLIFGGNSATKGNNFYLLGVNLEETVEKMNLIKSLPEVSKSFSLFVLK